MNQRQRNDLDNYSTGHYGEDQFKEYPEMTASIPTPYDAEIANTRGEYTRDLLMAKAEGYRAAKAEEDAERHRIDMLFQSLTPGGSEFVNDPERCVAWAKARMDNTWEALKKATLARNAVEAQSQALLEAARAALQVVHQLHPKQERIEIGVGLCTWRPCVELRAAIAAYKEKP